MTTEELTSVDAVLEECVDELGQLTRRLERFPEIVLAFALRAHLGGLLCVLRERQQITLGEVKEFLAALEAEALPPET